MKLKTAKNAAIMTAAAVLLGAALTSCGSSNSLTLNVYNWGEYISDGSEGSFDTVREFEKWYEENYGQKVTVNYTTYASNEDMYNKISSGAVSYDVIIPSDYMIARMADEELLQPLNFRAEEFRPPEPVEDPPDQQQDEGHRHHVAQDRRDTRDGRGKASSHTHWNGAPQLQHRNHGGAKG